MARIPLVTRDQIVEKEKPAYDAFMLSRANRPNIGPYSFLLHMPEMAQRLEALRIYLRDEASLPPKLQELVMISVAREMSCAFIWYAHAAAARQAGVRDDIVDNIRESTHSPTSIPRSKPWWTSPASFSRTERSAGLHSMPPLPDLGSVGPWP